MVMDWGCSIKLPGLVLEEVDEAATVSASATVESMAAVLVHFWVAMICVAPPKECPTK